MAERNRAREDEEWGYKEQYGNTLLDDVMRWFPNFRIDAFPPGCLTISGALALSIGLIFLVAALVNVVLPHYERVEFSVQTRCQVTEKKDDDLIGDELTHFTVEFPLPGIPGLMNGHVLCYDSHPCFNYEVGDVQDCYFDTQDHTVSFYAEMSGHHTIRLFSYVALGVPMLLFALCCLTAASAHWRRQLLKVQRKAREAWDRLEVDTIPYDRQRAQAAAGYSGGYQETGGYQQAHQAGGYQAGPREDDRAGAREDEGAGGLSRYNWIKMQMGL